MKRVRLTGILLGVVLLLAMAIVFAFTPGAWGANLSWSEVQLVDASGVPNKPVHGYSFKGILKVYGTKPVEGEGRTQLLTCLLLRVRWGESSICDNMGERRGEMGREKERG